MSGFQINIGGPSDQARQQIHLHLQIAPGASGPQSPGEIRAAFDRFRSSLDTGAVPGLDVARVGRHLSTLEEESKSAAADPDEIAFALAGIGRRLEDATGVSDDLLAGYRELAVALGFSVPHGR